MEDWGDRKFSWIHSKMIMRKMLIGPYEQMHHRSTILMENAIHFFKCSVFLLGNFEIGDLQVSVEISSCLQQAN